MKASKVVASTLIALAAVAAGSAFAQDSAYPGGFAADQASTSTLTRAQVQAEVAQARKDGTLDLYVDHNYPTYDASPSTKTRAQVQAEYRAARQAGQLPQDRS